MKADRCAALLGHEGWSRHGGSQGQMPNSSGAGIYRPRPISRCGHSLRSYMVSDDIPSVFNRCSNIGALVSSISSISRTYFTHFSCPPIYSMSLDDISVPGWAKSELLTALPILTAAKLSISMAWYVPYSDYCVAFTAFHTSTIFTSWSLISRAAEMIQGWSGTQEVAPPNPSQSDYTAYQTALVTDPTLSTAVVCFERGQFARAISLLTGGAASPEKLGNVRLYWWARAQLLVRVMSGCFYYGWAYTYATPAFVTPSGLRGASARRSWVQVSLARFVSTKLLFTAASTTLIEGTV